MSDHQVQRCAGCGILVGRGHVAELAVTAPDGIGVVCAACVDALARAVRRRGVDLDRAWRRLDGGWRRRGPLS